MPPLKVLIVGAGIGGPAAAFWLSRIGCDVTIVERSPTLRATGQQIDLTGQGIVLLRMMGIEDAVRAVRCPEPGMRVLDHLGRSKAYFPVNTSGKGLSPTRELEVMRGDLVHILYEATKSLKGVKYIFDSHIDSFAQDDEGSPAEKVHVTFSDGRQDDYDVLIGADGTGSATRGLMLGSSFPDPRRDLGVHMAFFTAPSREDDTYDWTVCHIPGGKALMTRKDRPENIRVYLATRTGRAALDAAKTPAEQKAVLAELFKGAEGCQSERFLRDLVEALRQIRLPEGAWSRGRVVLLGDAAYCPAPIGGGVATTAALVGAYVLAGEIAKQWKKNEESPGTFNMEEAAKEYERIVRPFITANSQVSPWMMRLWFPETRLGIRTFHALETAQEETQTLKYSDYFGLGSGR
ncbi:putative monooxygenase [Phialemonium atrogriseum]|uniref:Monooxygenase n=1 Tax=Phialemonium atrogriseum TaxID=1093897 RepID=A0AAJ0BSK2_9PEZI|nr:putative monooxygenase [Phialemonium atrogriseum]KAK1763486.1 putative monooxygenase [Phialemonium atrogriseum]